MRICRPFISWGPTYTSRRKYLGRYYSVDIDITIIDYHNHCRSYDTLSRRGMHRESLALAILRDGMSCPVPSNSVRGGQERTPPNGLQGVSWVGSPELNTTSRYTAFRYLGGYRRIYSGCRIFRYGSAGHAIRFCGPDRRMETQLLHIIWHS